MNSKTSVVFILPFFRCGGVEAWASHACKALNKYFTDVSIITLEEPVLEKNFFVDFPANIYSCESIFHAYCILIRKSFNSRVILVSALTRCNLYCLPLNILPNIYHISSVHLTLLRISAGNNFAYLARLFAHVLIVIFSSRTLAVSAGVKQDLLKIFFWQKNIVRKVSLIYNPCFSAEQLNWILQQKKTLLVPRNFPERFGCDFISAGRLHPQKGFARLIQAFDLLPDSIKSNSTLTIYGEGIEKDQLISMISDLNLASRVKILPFSSNIASKISKYDVFVLPSVYEGFGNVLAEALSTGIYCISFDCPHGPSEILANGDYGVLVSPLNVVLLSQAMKKSASYLERESYRNSLSSKSDSFYSHIFQFSVESFRDSIRKYLLI